MRIVHATGSIDPTLGGPPAVALRLTLAQRRLGHDAVIWTADPPRRRERLTPHCQAIGLEPVAWLSEADSQQDHHFKQIISSADFVHLHGVWDPPLLKAAKAARQSGVPYAVVPHGMLDPWSLSQKRWKKKIAMVLAYRSMLNHASFIHALNPSEAELMEPLQLKAPCEVVSNGVFLDEIDPLPREGLFRASVQGLGDAPFVLFLSRLHYKKGLDVLADAFALLAEQHPKVQLVVAGPDDGAKADFLLRVKEAGVSDRVHLVGPIYGKEKYQAMVDADCFCLPSRQEGFSVAILESLACRCPVVITEGCHFPEVQEVQAGRVVALNSGLVAGGLADILADPQARKMAGDAGRRLVEERFQWPIIAERLTALMEDYAASSRTPG